MTTLLVDGSNSFIRAFAAYPSTNIDGQPSGAIVGFLRSLRSFVEHCRPKRIVIVFDGEGGSKRRRALNPDYKNGRKPLRLNRTIEMSDDEERRSKIRQSVRLRQYLEDLPVSVIELPDIEADDVIAYLTQWLDGDKVIASNDKDFLQLLSAEVRIYRPTKHDFYTLEHCVQEHGIAPCNMALARAIAGDASDNIKGIKGVGLKKALKLFPILRDNKEVKPKELFALCEDSKDAKVKAFHQHSAQVQENYDIMSLKDPLISAHSIQRIKSCIDEYAAMKTVSLRSKLIRDAFDLGYDFESPFLQVAYQNKKRKNDAKQD